MKGEKTHHRMGGEEIVIGGEEIHHNKMGGEETKRLRGEGTYQEGRRRGT